ncbi:hypothetical protein [Jiella pelagia]|uniref:Uncharacterized protein n=1 Tax=Jiella pelagia TaxID=2986949 RepID=A0ABY7BXL7_9HYPH|nr:hypothetical protein [Jiella pelagia]WAP68581.1 hypothetical protein OH818_25410 [Jiella pelagia]
MLIELAGESLDLLLDAASGRLAGLDDAGRRALGAEREFEDQLLVRLADVRL